MKKLITSLSLVVADIFSLVIAFYMAYFIRVRVIQYLVNVANPWFFPIEHFYKMYYLLFVFILIFSYEKLYTRRYQFAEEFVYIVRGLFISVILIAVIVYLSRSYETFTRALPIIMMFTAMITVPLVRWIVKNILKVTGCYIKNVLVIGMKDENDRVIPVLEKLETTGYKIKDVLHLNPGVGDIRDGIRSVGDIETLIIISRGMDKEWLNRLINHWENHIKEIKIISDSIYLKTIGVETEYVEELLVMRMANRLLSPFSRLVKRVFDLVASFVLGIVMLPFFVLMGMLIKFDSRGPVLFIQERFGRQGRPFKILKFRTMHLDTDAKLQEYLLDHPEMREEWDRYKKLKTFDPRVTRIGKFLRRFSLDEFPQIYNVLKGDMSIVGPRPYLIREKEEIEKSAAIIFRVKSGLTGLWQIKGRNELSFDSRLKLDEFYVRNWSFFLDITIILKTFGVVLKGKGAY
ncbi:MAG: exopolysaccharide biosynthesis polyprenyl glycosylphosphotransferase [Candidatus Omnitrophota bacterium]